MNSWKIGFSATTLCCTKRKMLRKTKAVPDSRTKTVKPRAQNTKTCLAAMPYHPDGDQRIFTTMLWFLGFMNPNIIGIDVISVTT
jgi:hypothetical protein